MYENNRHTNAHGIRARIAALVLILIMLVAGSEMLFAQTTTRVNNLTVVPSFGFRRIDYGRGGNDVTGWGPGLEIAYDRAVCEQILFGASLTGEFFRYKDVANYTDIKISADMKFQLIPFEATDTPFKLYFCAGLGIDYAFSDDIGGSRIYFMARPGIQLNYTLMEGFDIVANSWGAFTINEDADGTRKDQAFHGSIGIGVSYCFGDPAPEANATEKAAEKAAKEAAAKAAAEQKALATSEPAPADTETKADVEPAPEAPAATEPAPEAPAATEQPAESAIAAAEAEAVKTVEVYSDRPYHTEQISYVTDSTDVAVVTSYTVDAVDIEKTAYYHKDIVVTRTVMIWD